MKKIVSFLLISVLLAQAVSGQSVEGSDQSRATAATVANYVIGGAALVYGTVATALALEGAIQASENHNRVDGYWLRGAVGITSYALIGLSGLAGILLEDVDIPIAQALPAILAASAIVASTLVEELVFEADSEARRGTFITISIPALVTALTSFF